MKSPYNQSIFNFFGTNIKIVLTLFNAAIKTFSKMIIRPSYLPVKKLKVFLHCFTQLFTLN